MDLFFLRCFAQIEIQKKREENESWGQIASIKRINYIYDIIRSFTKFQQHHSKCKKMSHNFFLIYFSLLLHLRFGFSFVCSIFIIIVFIIIIIRLMLCVDYKIQIEFLQLKNISNLRQNLLIFVSECDDNAIYTIWCNWSCCCCCIQPFLFNRVHKLVIAQ